MPEETLNIRLKNREDTLHPETLGINDLFKISKLIEEALVLTLSPDENIESDEDDPEKKSPYVSLTCIEPGSVFVKLSIPKMLLSAAVSLKLALLQSNYSELPISAQEKLANLYSYVSNRKWSVGLSGVTDGEAIISDEYPIAAPKQNTIQEITTIHGKCVKVGGDEDPRVTLRIHSTNKLMSVNVNTQLAEVLGKRLYDDIGLRGTATKDAHTLQLISFRANELLPYKGKNADPSGAIRKLAEIAERCKKQGTLNQ